MVFLKMSTNLEKLKFQTSYFPNIFQIVVWFNFPQKISNIYILFMDGGGKLLLTQVVSPRYSIHDDGVFFLLFELCECLRTVVSDHWKGNPLIRKGLPSGSHDKARPGSMSSKPKLNSKNILQQWNFTHPPSPFLINFTWLILSFGHIRAMTYKYRSAVIKTCTWPRNPGRGLLT